MSNTENSETIRVPLPTCGGTLVAEKTGDPDYPGISIYFEYDNGTELDVVIVEGPPKDNDDSKEINTYHYGDTNSDDWTDKLTINVPPRQS